MSRKHIDTKERSGHVSGVCCPVCKEVVFDNMGRHIHTIHGAERLQQYLKDKRCATPSEYKPCAVCGQLLHRASMKRHVQKAHTEGVMELDPGLETGFRPAAEVRVGSATVAERAATVTIKQAGNDKIQLIKDMMNPPTQTPKKKKQDESSSTKSQKQDVPKKNSYPAGQIHEAVRAMLNHRGTESYTRDKVRDACRREMPQLSESECDLATDVAIAAAREVASLSQYAAAYRNLNPGQEYKDALEQIVTLARGPKVETGYASFPAQATVSRPTFLIEPYKPTPALQSSRPYERAVSSGAFQPLKYPRSLVRLSDVADPGNSDSEFEAFGDTLRHTKDENPELDTVDSHLSETEDNDGSPLGQFIRSLRSPSPKDKSTSGYGACANTGSSTPAPFDSELIPGSQPSGIMRTPDQQRQQQFDATAEDREVHQLLERECNNEKESRHDPFADIVDYENDSQEYSQTY